MIDADAHTIEFLPALWDRMEQLGGGRARLWFTARRLLDRMRGLGVTRMLMPWLSRFGHAGIGGDLVNWYHLTWSERRRRRMMRPPWWVFPTENTLDRATAGLPKLLYERMEEIGLDFTVVYPSAGLVAPHLPNQELRRLMCRAVNTYHSEVFGDYAHRMTPVAVIPMHDPKEALEELEHAVRVLGMKAVMIAGHVVRPIPAFARRWSGGKAFWLDTYGIDSEHDYDPVWAKCVELGVAPTAHSFGYGWGSRQSYSNFMFNHLGHFAAAGEALCRSLFLGGVTRRFPSLKFGFMEGGVGWACSLYADLVEHWEKRNPDALARVDPARVDRRRLEDLYARYGDQSVKERLGELLASDAEAEFDENCTRNDEWARCEIERPEDIRELFVPHFYFGCESDDRINSWAFQDRVNPFGARLRIMLSSDLGHWDVPDIAAVVARAHELVDEGLITRQDFRDFVFTNPVRFHGSANPEFFEGTAVESAARELLLADRHGVGA